MPAKFLEMSNEKEKFIVDANNIVHDLKHRKTLNFNISKYQDSFLKGQQKFINISETKQLASNIKRHVLSKLPFYLEQFERNAIANNIEVLWAKDGEEALRYINQIIVDEKVKKVVKSKSMTSEEISFNLNFEHEGIECIETDLGEFIVQSAGEKPYHILTPAMHKSREDVATLFNKLYGVPLNATAKEIAIFARRFLREKFENCDMGLTGANFLLAREGAISLTENEGNGLFSITYPRVHVVLAGIEKIIPSVDYLDLFLPLLALHGTGQQITAYNSIITGSLNNIGQNRTKRTIVILLDNGRSKLFLKPTQSIALSCIRCGACLNSCPVYKNVGGYTYKSVYNGPIGSVIMPHVNKKMNYWHLSFASTLCGACSDVCPVKINLPELLLHNRREAIKRGRYEYWSDKFFIKVLSNILIRPFLVDFIAVKIKNACLKIISFKAFGKGVSIPLFTSMPFSLQWRALIRFGKK